MKHRTFLVAGALVAISMGTAALAIPAGAATNAPVVVACTSLKGGLTGASTITGCNNTPTTGGSGTVTAAIPKITIKWKSGKTSTGTESYVPVSPSKCPTGFSTEVKTTAKITGGTATTLVGGTGISYVCVGKTIENLPGTKANF